MLELRKQHQSLMVNAEQSVAICVTHVHNISQMAYFIFKVYNCCHRDNTAMGRLTCCLNYS